MEVSNVIFPGRKEDDLIDFESMYTVVKRLGIRNYRPSHSETCKRIWKELVPKSGQADSLQGELLRQAEKANPKKITYDVKDFE